MALIDLINYIIILKKFLNSVNQKTTLVYQGGF